MADKDMPTGVKLIAILYFIGAIFEILFGLIFLVAGGLLTNYLGAVGAILGTVGIIAGIILFVIGAVSFLIGRGLWHGKSWARLIALIFAGLGVLGGLLTLFGSPIFGIIYLAINGAIIWYLQFNKEGKSAFK